MLTKARLKKIFTRESKLQSSNCRTASRTSSKLKAETAPPFCRTSQNCSHFSDNKTRGSRLTDSEVCKFLQWVQVHGTRYTFAYRVFNTSLLPVRSTLFQPKMMQPKQILLPYEVFHSANGRPSNFTGQFNFCRSKMPLPEQGPRKKGNLRSLKSRVTNV